MIRPLARARVLIVHAWAGRSPFEEDAARKLAGLGYTALAMDVYGKGVLGGSPEENTNSWRPFRKTAPCCRTG